MIEVASKEKQLKNLEDIIEHSKERAETHWFEIGKALSKIRDGKLHPQRTFEQYCLQRWQFTRRRANQICHTFELLKDSKMGSVLPQNTESVPTSGLSSRAAEALATVPEEQREEVVNEAKKSGKVTGRSVKAAAKKSAANKTRPEHPTDRKGYKIPERAWAIWNRRNEIREQLRPLYELKQWCIDMQETTDIFYRVRGLDFAKCANEITQVIFKLKQAIPDVVCTKCQGIDPACDFCYGRGMISLDLAESVTPIEMKKMRKLESNDSVEKLSSASR